MTVLARPSRNLLDRPTLNCAIALTRQGKITSSAFMFGAPFLPLHLAHHRARRLGFFLKEKLIHFLESGYQIRRTQVSYCTSQSGQDSIQSHEESAVVVDRNAASNETVGYGHRHLSN
jgi:hypothetical protein